MADFLGMMKQAAQLQSKMQAMQEELGHVEVEGISGGGLVTVRMTAKMEVKAVKIDPSLMKAEEREILEDLLVTAHNDARRKAEAAMQEKMQSLTGGLGLPPGLGLDLKWPAAVAGPEIERLIQLLARLPGLGPRSARRAALHLIKKREALMTPLAGGAAGGDRQDPGLQDLRQYRHPKSLHGMHRSAARSRDHRRGRRRRRSLGAGAGQCDQRTLPRARRDAVAARRRRSAGSDHRRAGRARA